MVSLISNLCFFLKAMLYANNIIPNIIANINVDLSVSFFEVFVTGIFDLVIKYINITDVGYSLAFIQKVFTIIDSVKG